MQTTTPCPPPRPLLALRAAAAERLARRSAPPRPRDTEPCPPPCCDGCGARGVELVREPVEGIVCERCEHCRALGVVP